MNQRKSRKFNKPTKLTGEALAISHITRIDSDVNYLIRECISQMNDPEYQEEIKYELYVIEALIDAMGNIAEWCSEDKCNDVYDFIGYYQAFIKDIKTAADIKHM